MSVRWRPRLFTLFGAEIDLTGMPQITNDHQIVTDRTDHH
jgi:hypothetical protein